MADIERMPKSGYTMREGLVSKILVREGQRVSRGAPLLEYETDKLTGTVEASRDGVVLRLLAREEESYPVLAPLVILGEEGEDVPLPEDAPDREATPAREEEAPAPRPPQREGRILATPCARRLAREKGISLETLAGTGPGGRVQKRDVLLAAEQRPKATHLAERLARDSSLPLEGIPGTGARGRIQKTDVLSALEGNQAAAGQREKLSPMRRTIAARLTESKQNIPHVYYTRDLHMGALAGIRQSLAGRGEEKLTYNDLLLFAVSRALQRYPDFTASLQGDEAVYPPEINLGMAVTVEGGLVVPVLRNAGALTLLQTAREAARLSQAAREKRLSPADMSGGCFTVSNLGKYGIREFSAIINPPEAAILAVGAVEDRACVRDGQVVIEKLATVTLSADHRLIDGAMAAEFLQYLNEIVQEPWRMLL